MHKRVAIGDMVYLTNDREGIVRFKGKTGFALGEWYGIELRTDTKTRHDGLIHGKRYFRCPRNKGLFVRKQIIKDVMDKKTAEQKTRVFKMGGRGRNVTKLNKKIQRKYNQQHPKPKKEPTKKKAKKKQAKTDKKATTNMTKKETVKKDKMIQSKTVPKPSINNNNEDKEESVSNGERIKKKELFNEATKEINKKILDKQKKQHNKRSSIIEKQGDDTKYIKLSDFTPTTTVISKKRKRSITDNDNDNDNDNNDDIKDEEKEDKKDGIEDDDDNNDNNEDEEDEEEDEERKDFGAKESFSHPKSRKYFGKDQVFTGLDRRRSKYEDILLIDPVSLVTHNEQKEAEKRRSKLGTKRRNSKKRLKLQRKDSGKRDDKLAVNKAASALSERALGDLMEEEEMSMIREEGRDEKEEKTASPPPPPKEMAIEEVKKKRVRIKDKKKGKKIGIKGGGLNNNNNNNNKSTKPPPVELDIDSNNLNSNEMIKNKIIKDDDIPNKKTVNFDIAVNPNSKSIKSKISSLSPQYSPFMESPQNSDNTPSIDTTSPSIPSPSPSSTVIETKRNLTPSKYRPFGGDTSPKKNHLTPKERIKHISMEFSAGNLKAKLKKVVTTKRKKRNGTIRNVYEKYAVKADYPKLDDLRNETLVSEFLSLDLYNLYRDEINIINDYSIDRAIECGCFYLPDPIGFRLGDFHTYEIFQDLCDELLCILHDEWNPNDRPHKKNTDWRLLLNINQNQNNQNIKDPLSSHSMIKRSKSPNIGGNNGKKRRNRKGSKGMFELSQSQNIKEKRKKSKRRKNTNTELMINEDEEINITSTAVSVDLTGRNFDYNALTKPIQRSESELLIKITKNNDDDDDDADNDNDDDNDECSHYKKKRKREKRRKSHKRGQNKERNTTSFGYGMGGIGGIRHSAHSGGLGGGGRTGQRGHVRSSLFQQSSSFMMARMSLWDNDYVSSCRITLSRNINGFCFSNCITRNERRNIEKVLSSCLSQCNEGPLKGRYRPYSKINKKKLPLLIETDKLFPKPDAPALIMAGYARDWPESRGIFINSNKNLYIWCNYLEHLHLISTQNDGNILMAFKRLFDSESKLEKLIKQRQELFLNNLLKKQQDIFEKEKNWQLNKEEIVAKSPTIISGRNTSSPKTTKEVDQMLVAETPTHDDNNNNIDNNIDNNNTATITFSQLMRAEQEKDEKRKNNIRKIKGPRLTKQEYRIKRMNINRIETGFVFDDELGYISSNPQYFGTSMRVYVTVKLPNLIKHEKFNDILEIRNLTAYQHDIDSAQQMFMAYSSQLPSKDEVREVRERRNSTSNQSNQSNQSLTNISKPTTNTKLLKKISNEKNKINKEEKKSKINKLNVNNSRNRSKTQETTKDKKIKKDRRNSSETTIKKKKSLIEEIKDNKDDNDNDNDMLPLNESTTLNTEHSNLSDQAKTFRRKSSKNKKKRISKNKNNPILNSNNSTSSNISNISIKSSKSSRSSRSNSTKSHETENSQDSIKISVIDHVESNKKTKIKKKKKKEKEKDIELLLDSADSDSLSNISSNNISPSPPFIANNNSKDCNDFMSNLNLPGNNINNIQDSQYNEPKFALKALTASIQKQQSAPIDDEQKTKTQQNNLLIHDDEDLGDVVDPLHYKEEITIYQTVSLGISEVEQVRTMIEAINYLIQFEKLLSAGNKLDERIKAEKLKKSKNKQQQNQKK